MISSLGPFHMPLSSSTESASRSVIAPPCFSFPIPSSSSHAGSSCLLADQPVSTSACFSDPTPMRTVVSTGASGSGPACDPHSKFGVYSSTRDVHGDAVFHPSSETFSMNGKRRRLEGSSNRRAESNGSTERAHSDRSIGNGDTASAADPSSRSGAHTPGVSAPEATGEAGFFVNSASGGIPEEAPRQVVEEGTSAQGRSMKEAKDGIVAREEQSVTKQAFPKIELSQGDAANEQRKRDRSVDAAPPREPGPNERCSLCGQPRLWGRREREGGDKDGACEAGAGVNNDDDDAWVCEACLKCAEADVKKEEELLRQRQDQAKPRHTAQERVKSEDKVRSEHERKKEQRSKGRNASSASAATPSRSPAAPANHSASSSQNRLPFASSAGTTTTSSAADFSQTEPESSSWGSASGGGKRGDVNGSTGVLPLERDGAPLGTGPPAPRASALPPGVAVASPPAAGKRTDEGTIRSTTVHVGPNHQVPALPAFFLDSSCWPRPPSDAVLDPSLTARLVYSPSALQRIRVRREQEGRKDRAIVSEADMTAFVKACSQNWKTRPGWQPFSPEFAYKILHYAGYDPVRALQLMNDPQFSFREVCDPPLRKYDNKWKPKDRRGLIAATPYPPPISARGSLARRHHHREVSGYSLR
ncbi:hypothetical protein CSUI_003742 [Cystoisospora suis]|uniref:ELM2 domain-containing protein n=1 Tax=Cystoisospora suis TaxID=483139 RepID=A0A2C6L4A5_9APIC|nr:hypothetical protein CSUI_003742 [Cystoisospora suis]